jgi:hypothetical protein
MKNKQHDIFPRLDEDEASKASRFQGATMTTDLDRIRRASFYTPRAASVLMPVAPASSGSPGPADRSAWRTVVIKSISPSPCAIRVDREFGIACLLGFAEVGLRPGKAYEQRPHCFERRPRAGDEAGERAGMGNAGVA